MLAPFAAALPFALLGLHLLRIARRSGATPDRLLTAFFLLLAAGIPPRMLGVRQSLIAGHDATSYGYDMAANALIGSAMVCLAAFTWQVFRSHEAWAKRLVGVFACALFAVFLAAGASVEASSGSGIRMIVFNGLNVSAIVWAHLECLLYYRTMRRRQRLGLADPVLANRFLLWSFWTGAIALQGLCMLLLRIGIWSSGAHEVLQVGGDPGGPWLVLIDCARGMLAIVGPTAVISVWLSFSPPAFYTRRLQRRPLGRGAVDSP